MSNETVSIIILNWNGKEHLKTCLDSVQNQSYSPIEIIFVDNGSTDNSVEFVTNNYPDVICLALSSNTGFCKGNNEGIKISKGQYIFLLNNDTEMHSDCIMNCIKAIKTSEDIGLIATKMVFFDDKTKIDCCGIGYKKSCVGYKIGWLDRDNEQYNKRKYVFGACGGATLIKKELLEKINNLEELYLTNNEDIDLSFKAQLLGYKCLYEPEAVVLHKVSATAGISTPFTLYQTQRNIEIVWLINVPKTLFVLFLPLHLIYSTISFILRCSEVGFKLIFQAKLSVIKLLPEIYKRRCLVQKSKLVSLQYLFSIIK